MKQTDTTNRSKPMTKAKRTAAQRKFQFNLRIQTTQNLAEAASLDISTDINSDREKQIRNHFDSLRTTILLGILELINHRAELIGILKCLLNEANTRLS